MYLPRDAEQVLADILDCEKVGIVLGARQVGKTTLVEHVTRGRGALALSFDLDVDQARFRAAAALTPVDARRSLGSPPLLIIDEAQRLPDAPRIVKGWHDVRLPMRILLLGSPSLDPLDQAAESGLPARPARLIGHATSGADSAFESPPALGSGQIQAVGGRGDGHGGSCDRR